MTRTDRAVAIYLSLFTLYLVVVLLVWTRAH